MYAARIFPTVADLVALAIAGTDFISEITGDPDDVAYYADTAMERAAEAWEEANGVIPGEYLPYEAIRDARQALIAHGEQMLRQSERDAEDARRDAIEAGGLTSHGTPVSPAFYRSV